MSTASVVHDSLPSFAEVVKNVQEENPEGLDQLYRVLRMLSGPLRRQWGYQDYEDRMHDTFLVVVEAIRQGKLREPGALPSYILGIARLSLCSNIGVRVRHERLYGTLRHWIVTRQGKTTPEEALAEKERVQIMRNLLYSLSDKERQILTRFYLHEHTKEQICRDMNLTDTQFRLAKSRAKQRLGRIGYQHLNHAEATPTAAAA
jgi:RNA polymerase sigma-70 factor (ECF subfamily)